MILIKINKHILELKNRILLLIFSWLTTISVCYLFKEIILHAVITSFYIYNPYFILTDVAELFKIYLKITLFLSNQIFIIFFLYHSIMFFSSGMYKNELRTMLLIYKFITITIFTSLILNKLFVMPLMTNFFLQFQNILNKTTTIPIFFEAKLKEYINFYISFNILIIINLLGFIILLAIMNNTLYLNYQHIKKIRKLFYFVFLIFSTLIKPPDIISQIILTLILIISYEISLFINIIKITVTN